MNGHLGVVKVCSKGSLFETINCGPAHASTRKEYVSRIRSFSHTVLLFTTVPITDVKVCLQFKIDHPCGDVL